MHDAVAEYDVLLGSGQIVTCSGVDTPDLFRALPGSRGTLGFVLRARLLLRRCTGFVELRRVVCADAEGVGRELLRRAAGRGEDVAPDFLDAVALGAAGGGVVVEGRFVQRRRRGGRGGGGPTAEEELLSGGEGEALLDEDGGSTTARRMPRGGDGETAKREFDPQRVAVTRYGFAHAARYYESLFSLLGKGRAAEDGDEDHKQPTEILSTLDFLFRYAAGQEGVRVDNPACAEFGLLRF